MTRLFHLVGWDDPVLTVRGLVRIAGGILVLSLLVTYLTTEPTSRTARAEAIHELRREGFAAAEEVLVRWLEEHPGDREIWLALVEMRAASGLEESAPFLALLERSTDPGPRILTAWYLYRTEGLEEGLRALEHADGAQERLARGQMLANEGRDDEAIESFEAALEVDPGLDEAREAIVDLLFGAGDHERVRRLLDDPDYRDVIDDSTAADVYCSTGEYGAMAWSIVRLELTMHAPRNLVPLLLVGLAWSLVSIHLGWYWRWRRSGTIVAALAFALGYLSAIALLPVLVAQDRVMPEIGPDTGMAYNLFYCVIGIGLKEEAVKILFLLPLVPLLVRSGSHLRILTTASLVGLGFAVNENLYYYLASGGTAVFARFLTANFLHMVLTGYTGYYLVRAFQKGGEAWLDFLSEGTKMFVIHGIYDWLLMEPRAGDLSFFATVAFILLSQMYLRLVVEISPTERRPIPLTRLFVAALSLAAGMGYLLAAREFGLWLGFLAIASGAVGSAIIAVMYFREFNETVDR